MRPSSPARKGCYHHLCWLCYDTAAIRVLYVPPPRQVDFYGGYQQPAAPTTARPGTDEKIAVLTERVAARSSLWHPQDRR